MAKVVTPGERQRMQQLSRLVHEVIPRLRAAHRDVRGPLKVAQGISEEIDEMRRQRMGPIRKKIADITGF